MGRRLWAVLTVLLLVAVASSCGDMPPLVSAVPSVRAPTAVPAATATPPPTATRVSTATRPPTAAARPTDTSRPTARPTAGPRPSPAVPPTPAATDTPAVVLTPLGQLPAWEGREVTVEATIAWVSSFSSGFKFLLDDGTGQATLLLWLNVYDDCWDAPKLLVGALVRAHGTVGQYQGEWEVQAGYGGDVQVLAPGAPPPLRQIGTLSGADLTTRVTIEGTVSRVEPFSQGQRLYVDDGSGTLLVLLWQNVFERVKENSRLLTPGTRVRADGIVQEYRGTLELVPQVPSSVMVLP